MTQEERNELAELLFPNITKTREYYEEMYPERDLPEGAMVTRQDMGQVQQVVCI